MNGPDGAVYIDASAVVKLAVQEQESDALAFFLEDRPVRVSSEILRVELLCTCRRRGTPPDDALALLDGITLIPVTSEMLDRASEAFDPPQRTLDAIHLAAAETMRNHLGSFVSYDGEQRHAAEALGWAVHAPA
jgi:predicted nucleic acid-binding protein